MKTNIKNMSKSLNAFILEYHSFIDNYKIDFLNEIIKSNQELLENISKDYDLDYDELEKKYLINLKNDLQSNKNKNLIDIDDNDSDIDLSTSINKNEQVLERKEIDGKICFIDNKIGCIYNEEVIKIGQVENGKYKLFTK